MPLQVYTEGKRTQEGISVSKGVYVSFFKKQVIKSCNCDFALFAAGSYIYIVIWVLFKRSIFGLKFFFFLCRLMLDQNIYKRCSHFYAP